MQKRVTMRCTARQTNVQAVESPTEPEVIRAHTSLFAGNVTRTRLHRYL